jgi:hypothetical protein
MNEAFREGQGTIIPTLFLGLGGTGSRIVDRIASRAVRLPNWESQLRPLTSFVSVDTNELDQHKLAFIPEGNRFNIAAFDKAKAIESFRRSKDPQALQWLDKGYQPRPGFKPGAGQIRVESRLGFFYHSAEIRQRLKALVAETLRPGVTWRQITPPKYNVYVYCTLAGGTGSGNFLSVAYLVDALIREQNWQPRLVGNLLLSTLMLDKVGPELHPDIHANTYAALKELEHLTKLDYDQVKREGRTTEEFVYWRNENARDVQRVQARPFFLSFIFDRPPHLSLPDVETAVGDAAYLQVFTPIIENLAGELDNYEKRLEALTRFPGDLKHVGLGYTKNFGVFGAVALVLPAADLLEYCALRFAAQALRSQITFGVDPGDASDDRARALARLAVDYSDPKFLSMSDEGRERTINQAFVACVQEMARQDARQDLRDGFWYELVESIDQGRLTGTTERGEEQRGESQLALVERKLAEARRELLVKVSIKERAFVFHKEGLNQYIEYVSRLAEDIRAAAQLVEEGRRGVEAAAGEGELVDELRLNPIAERYLVVRLLEQCEREWLPQAQEQLDKARAKDISNPAVRERLESELYASLQAAAARRGLMGRNDQAFLDARDEAQEEYRKVAKAALQTFDADLRLRQLRALHGYLVRRSRQYARLATRMDALVHELEREAERLRRGESAVEPALALRVEVLETLDEPRDRLWNRAYHALFIDRGRSLGTFDRDTLAATVARELKPVVRPDGSVAEKSLEQTVNDLRRALVTLGRQRLRPTILGDEAQTGLDLVSALELEAQLVLRAARGPAHDITLEELEEYRDKKFRALAQLAGVMARVSTADAKALDDGVVVNQTRQLITGLADRAGSPAAARFLGRLKSILGGEGRQVKEGTWHDPRLIVVHDVELPIPLYYVEPVVGEIEDAYLVAAADERRSYQLHTDYKWEKSLPNLNPRKAEITVGWALGVLAEGLLTRVIARENGMWVWPVSPPQHVEHLGSNLSGALYRLGEIHRRGEALARSLEQALRTAREALGPDMLAERRREMASLLDKVTGQMESRELHGETRRDDLLDKPVLRTLIRQLQDGQAPDDTGSGAPAGDVYEPFGR